MRSWLKCLEILHILSDISQWRSMWAQESNSIILTREETLGVGDSVTMVSLDYGSCLGNKISAFTRGGGNVSPQSIIFPLFWIIILLSFGLFDILISGWWQRSRELTVFASYSSYEDATQERTEDLLLYFVGWLHSQWHLVFLILFALCLIFPFWIYFLL